MNHPNDKLVLCTCGHYTMPGEKCNSCGYHVPATAEERAQGEWHYDDYGYLRWCPGWGKQN